ncbi:hypothetical protein BU15DRAFT_80178 [Melanogaster broomeanus]|nr:hypothetical protein BU15DRAFT_80178 [Melanogaster broomeanus]
MARTITAFKMRGVIIYFLICFSLAAARALPMLAPAGTTLPTTSATALLLAPALPMLATARTRQRAAP